MFSLCHTLEQRLFTIRLYICSLHCLVRLQAEGVEKEYNQAVLIDLKNSSSFQETVAIDFPPGVISDSTRVQFSVVGESRTRRHNLLKS